MLAGKQKDSPIMRLQLYSHGKSLILNTWYFGHGLFLNFLRKKLFGCEVRMREDCKNWNTLNIDSDPVTFKNIILSLFIRQYVSTWIAWTSNRLTMKLIISVFYVSNICLLFFLFSFTHLPSLVSLPYLILFPPLPREHIASPKRVRHTSNRTIYNL